MNGLEIVMGYIFMSIEKEFGRNFPGISISGTSVLINYDNTFDDSRNDCNVV